MKWLVVFVILSLEDSAGGQCTCEISPLSYTNFNRCVYCRLAEADCRIYHSYITTENECVQLMMNSTVYNGIEWKYVQTDSAKYRCRTILCQDVQTIPYPDVNDQRTVYWKTCDADCGCLQKPQNGFVTTTVDTNLEITANYFCNSGYILSGPSTIICNDNGNWSGSPPTCIIDCHAPIAPADGYVNFTSTTLASQANFSCNAGFVLTGSPYTTCESNGLWNDSQTACVIDCFAPIPPKNGSVNYNLTILNSQANYSCNEGFDLSDSSNITCEANGNWSESQVVCLIKDCKAPTPLLNGSVNYTFTTFRSQATYSCDEGFYLNGSSVVTCAANGNWSDLLASCSIKDCLAPTPPSNGSVNYTSTIYNSQATYSCDQGFTLNGSTHTTCGANRNWSDPLPTCTIQDCNAPILPANGFVNFTSTTYNSQANYSCDQGFDLNGSTHITCGTNGNWSDPFPTCTIQDCNAPIPPANGFVNFTSTTYNSQANYSCDQGFTLNGSSHTTCGANGNWTDPFPTCTIKDCKAPIPPANGFVNFSATTYNSQANYSCDQGFTLNGSTHTTCGNNSNWTNTPPYCTIIDCKEPSQVINGEVDFNETTYGKQSVYSCHPGFDIIGPNTLTCKENGLWGPFQPSCLDPGSKKKPLYITPCLCYPKKTFNNMTQDEILTYLENATSIDTKNTSAALDKLRSRSDSRTSSAVIGTVGVVILSTLAGLIVCMDLITICRKRNARRKSE